MSTTADIENSVACDQCGADLQGTSWDGACPSCGQTVAGMWELSIVDEASGTLTTDVPCVGCEYNLRTLKVLGRCPECGRPVIDSLSRKRLCFMDAALLEELRLGCFMGVGTLLTALLCFLIPPLLIFGVPFTIIAFPAGLAMLPVAEFVPRSSRLGAPAWTGIILLCSLVTMIMTGAWQAFFAWIVGMLLTVVMFIGRRVLRLVEAVVTGHLVRITRVWSIALCFWTVGAWVVFLVICLIPAHDSEFVAFVSLQVDAIVFLICYGLSVIVFIGLWRAANRAVRLQEALGIGDETESA